MDTLLQKLYCHADTLPLKPALVGEHSSYSYREMLDASLALSARLQASGVSTLALIADNGPEWVIMDLACQMAACCFIPLPLFFSPAQIEHSLARAGVDTLVAGAGIGLPGELSRLPALDGLGHGFKAVRLPGLAAAARPEHTHKITFTSGSTGQPKGVCLNNTQQQAVAESLMSMIAIDQPRHLCILPLATLLENIAGVYAPLLAGGSVHLPSLASLGFSGSSRVDAGQLLAAISEHQPQSMILIPQLLDLLIVSVLQGWEPPASLKMIAVGGSRVAPAAIQQARQLGLPVYEGYGLSECASVVSFNTPAHDHPGSAGRVLPHLAVQVIDGEIHVLGNSFLGYLGEADSWHAGSVATGDLGHIDDRGFIQLQGRRKNLLISSYGRNINPEWVESEVLAHPLIQQCIVVGDARPFCSALIYAHGDELNDSDIQQWLDRVNQALPDYARLRNWLRLNEPMSNTNKLLTANGRPRRQHIMTHYAPAIEQLYARVQEKVTA